MINKILFIQPFLLESRHIASEILVWEVYLENYLKSKFPHLSFDLLYLPIELKRGSLAQYNADNIALFNSQMEDLISSLIFELDKNTLICISGSTSYHFIPSKILAEYFQKYYPEIILVFGGFHASASPEDFYYPNSPIDYVVIGEGEISLYNLIRNNPKKQETPNILRNI